MQIINLNTLIGQNGLGPSSFHQLAFKIKDNQRLLFDHLLHLYTDSSFHQHSIDLHRPTAFTDPHTKSDWKMH